jgi:opacity protein-like surface antigen
MPWIADTSKYNTSFKRKEDMYMKQMLKIAAAFFVVAIVCIAVSSTDADAQSFATVRPGGRAGTWDFFMPLTYNPPETWNGQGGSKLDLDATWGFGFGFGYNFSDHFQLNGLFSWTARNYTATIVPATGTPPPNNKYSNTEYSSTFGLNGIYYLLSGNISPFVSGGVGWTYIDTSIPNGPSSGTCWWDPWYGYVCSSYYPTKTQSDWSYNFGVGVRFDLNRQFSLAPSYNRAWIDVESSSGTPYVDIWRLDFIFRM